MADQRALPGVLQAKWLQRREDFRSHHAGSPQQDWLEQYLLADDAFARQLALVWSCSDYVADFAVRHPRQFQELVDSGDLQRRYSGGHFHQCCMAILADADCQETLCEETVARLLRQLRKRELVRIIWRDFCRLADFAETTADISALAAASIDAALDFLYPQLCERYGTPVGDQSNTPQQLAVLGMGKLGATELNISSDIDLIFAYPENGDTQFQNAPSQDSLSQSTLSQGRRRNCSNQEFFERLGRKLIQLLDNRTADGFVFRVDMRLRPYGGSGPLVGSFDALELYYQTQGRDWERFAMIKAHPVAGDLAAGNRLLKILRPFTYRKYIDYSVIQALRDIKALIEQEVHRTGAQDDVKRGHGGIREVEFIAQAFQLIRGGRDPRLQRPSLLEVLPLLEQENLLPVGKAAELKESYTFLRNVEHALQGIADQQTQTLPEDELGRMRLATLMDCEHWGEFSERLKRHRTVIANEFAAVVAAPPQQVDAAGGESWQQGLHIWQLVQRGRPVAELLAAEGYDEPESSEQRLQALLASRQVQLMQTTARERLDSLMPALLAGCARLSEPSQLLHRILGLVETVARRSAYLLLLVENPGALQQLLTLCAASPWIADQISNHPALLDELLDPRTLYAPHDKTLLADELRQQLLRIPEQDMEAQLEALRYFKRSNRLRVAACEVTDALPLMKVSDNLTWIAEVLLEQVLELVWGQMTARFGHPAMPDKATDEPAFLIVGYGKLGGIEMGHNSDLDLVFLYDADPNQHTDGERGIDNATFFLRLGQRIIHLLTTRTALGVLYDVDMRLRPSGNAGMLVTSLAGFAKYQREGAWTWEHQALVRARPVAGSPELARQFNQLRCQVLAEPRDPISLVEDVCTMRRKMHDHLNKGDSTADGELFDLKQGRGGIVDIEFMVQFAVLSGAPRHPRLLDWSDNIRILESMAESGILSSTDAQQLIEAYKSYRAAGHRAQLQQQSGLIAAEQFATERQQVMAMWRQLLKPY